MTTTNMRPFWGVPLLIGLNLLAAGLILWMGWDLLCRMDDLARLSLHAQAELYKQQIRQCVGGGGRWSEGRTVEECALGVLAQEDTLLEGLEVLNESGAVVFSQATDAGPADPALLITLPMKVPRAVEYQVRFRFRPEAAGEWMQAGRRHFSLSLLISGLLAILSGAIWLLHRKNLALQRDLLQARHLSELGLMAAAMAHELRNPLSSIRGLSQVLAESDRPEGREHLDTIVRETGRMERLVEDLLLFSKPRDPGRDAVELKPLLQGVVEELGLGGRVRIEAPDGLTARGDGEQFRQVFLNLLKNAAEALAPEEKMEIAGGPRGKAVCVAFRNPAPELTAADLDWFFTPFHTTKSRGTGLGLFLSSRIVERHGGSLRASLDAKGWLTLEVVLPRG